MLPASGGLGGAGSSQVGDGQQEGTTATKWATRRFPSDPWHVHIAMPVPLTPSLPKAEGGKELR